MLKAMRGGQRWLTAFFIVALGGVFVFFLVPGMGQRPGGPSGGALIEVGSHRFGIPQFQAERERRTQQYEQLLGDQFDARALADQLNELTAQVLIERAILADEATRLGIVVSKQEIERAVLQSPSFRAEDGQFDAESFDRFIQYEYGTERNFMADQRLVMLAAKMAQILDVGAQVSSAEARDSLMRRLEELRIAFVVLDPGRDGADVEVPEDRIAAILAEREDEVRELYSQRAAIYDVPEQVRARHILLTATPDADAAEVALVEERAEAVLARLRAGEDFATVAAEVSEDPGSKDKGGDLGLFGRGQMVAPFEEAAFSLEPGTRSDVVRSDFGFHVILVEEHNLARKTPFEEVRSELARELAATEVATAKNREIAERLSAAIRGGASLEDAARAEELTLERSDWLRRRPDGFVPGLGAAPDLLVNAFALQPGQSATTVYEIGSKLALVQVLERRMPGDVNLDQGIEQERAQLQNEKRNLLAQNWIAERRKALADAGQLAVDLEPVSGWR